MKLWSFSCKDSVGQSFLSRPYICQKFYWEWWISPTMRTASRWLLTTNAVASLPCAVSLYRRSTLASNGYKISRGSSFFLTERGAFWEATTQENLTLSFEIIYTQAIKIINKIGCWSLLLFSLNKYAISDLKQHCY